MTNSSSWEILFCEYFLADWTDLFSLNFKSLKESENFFFFLQLTEDGISSDFKRHDLFKDLLEKSHKLEQFLALSSLLQVWPPLEAVSDR